MIRYIAFLAIAITILATAGCGRDLQQATAESSAPKTVTVALARKAAEVAHDEFMGTVSARNRADVESRVPGTIEQIVISLGSKVNKGDLLAKLDTREFKARVEQARAMYQQASQDLARFEVLVAQQAATQQEFDGIKARAAVTEAALNEAETYLSYGAIVAPFSGTVVGKAVDVGDAAMPGKPLFTIEQTGAALFVTTLPESKLGQIIAGDSLSVSVGSPAITVRGKVEELSPSPDPMSHTFMLKLSLPLTPGISPGQFGRLLLPAGEDETIFIPRAGLVRRGQLDLVYVVSAENRAMLRLVRIGRQFPDRLEILSGLRESEKVVISDQRDLFDGDLVREVS